MLQTVRLELSHSQKDWSKIGHVWIVLTMLDPMLPGH